MSATIKANGLKFVIFASGHDYTLADSGDGNVQVFSHPFVPKGSKNYAGQWYFIVPDENGNPLDCVKDDIAHCTFTPAIGSTFSTVGDVTVECHYHREYTYPEETVVVDKTVKQTITVVNHGSKTGTDTNIDVYSDGYGFIRPQNTSTVEVKDYSLGQKNTVKKLSSIPWRATGLGLSDNYTGFFSSTSLEDISELKYADVSNCEVIISPFGRATDLDLTPIADWDVSKVTVFRSFIEYSGISSLKPLKKWNTSNFVDMEFAFSGFQGDTLEGLEDWDVSNVEDMRQIFDHSNITDASAIALWNVAKVQRLDYAFSTTYLADTSAVALWNVVALRNIEGIYKGCEYLTDLSGLSNWTADITDISEAFSLCISLTDISGVSGLNVSNVTDFMAVFAYCTHLVSLNGLDGWDVSSGETFYRMFKGCCWISNISALANWNMTNATELGEMFNGCAWVTSVDDLANWRLYTQNVNNMLTDGFGCYSAKIGKSLWYNAYYFYDYEDNQYTNSVVQDEDTPLTYPTYNADKARLWGVHGSNLYAFDAKWTNKPSWN